MRALAGLHPDLIRCFTPLTFGDSIGPQDLIVDVFSREMGIGLEHIGREAAPHHQLDDTLGYVFFDEVRDT